MNFLRKFRVKKYLKEIESDVDKELMGMGLLKIENGKKDYALGSVNVKWDIQKKLLKDRYNIDWKSPKDKNPNINFD